MHVFARVSLRAFRRHQVRSDCRSRNDPGQQPESVTKTPIDPISALPSACPTPQSEAPPQSGLISPIHPTELNEETKDLFRYFPAGNERQSRAFLMWTGISPLIPASPLPVQKPRVPRGAFLCPKGHPQKAENYGARKLVSRCYEIIRMGKTCGNIRDLRQMFASTWLGAGPIDAVSAESKK